jgi:hypothetical protein
MMVKRSVILILSVLLLGLLGTAGSAAAQTPAFPPIEIIDAEYGGTGCPAGTASVVFTRDTLSMLFDAYVAATSSGNQTVRKSCNFAVELRIPPGYTIALLKIDYRGYADIPPNGLGRLVAEYFWAGRMGPIYTRNFPAGYFGNWMETDFVGGEVWSRCGGEVIARANTSVVARKESPFSPYEAEVQVDSVDLEAGVIYQFVARPC